MFSRSQGGLSDQSQLCSQSGFALSSCRPGFGAQEQGLQQQKKNLTEHKFNSLAEDLLTVDLSCHTLFPFSSNYSAVRQTHCKAAWEINPCVRLLENLCVGFLWHKTHFHINVNNVFCQCPIKSAPLS